MLNKLILRAFLSISLALSFTGAANATLISQDLISDETGNVIGSITINTIPSEIADFGLSDVFVFEEFNLFGFDMAAPAIADGNQFFASFDTADYSLGLQDLSFDLVDTLGAIAWNGQFFGGFGAVDAFDLGVVPNPEILAFIEFSLGDATVVPTPATLVLFLTAVAGLVARRKTH
jgi:hypothetical protein